jgi:hypothetical protein
MSSNRLYSESLETIIDMQRPPSNEVVVLTATNRSSSSTFQSNKVAPTGAAEGVAYQLSTDRSSLKGGREAAVAYRSQTCGRQKTSGHSGGSHVKGGRSTSNDGQSILNARRSLDQLREEI